MGNKLNIGVIGVGHLGRVHLAKLRSFQDCHFYGFYDIDRQKSHRIALETGAHEANSLEEILRNCDLVSIVVPTSEHYNVGLKALESGTHIFMEKPLTATVDQGEELLHLAEKQGVKLGVGHIERFNPAVAGMAGKIGHPVFIEAHRLNPFNPRGLDVAVILELMIHDIDLCLYFTGSEVVDIQASGVKVLSDQMDIANARLTFKSGCVANLTASRISPAGMRKIRIFQENSYLSFDLKEKTVDSFTLIGQTDAELDIPDLTTSFAYGETGKKIIYQKPHCPIYDMLEEELRQFVNCIKNDTSPPVNGREGLAALKVALTVEEKAREGLEKIGAGL